jgi:hypothetical protein
MDSVSKEGLSEADHGRVDSLARELHSSGLLDRSPARVRLSDNRVANVSAHDPTQILEPDSVADGPNMSQDASFLFPAELGLDDMQARDWPHRSSDSCPSWPSLWKMPPLAGSNGAMNCGGCMCGHRACTGIAAGGSGQNVHDCVLCWNCRRCFAAPCIPGFDSILAMAQGKARQDKPTARAMILGWGRCPRCAAQLGSCSLPTVFAMLLGSMACTNPDADTAGSPRAAVKAAMSFKNAAASFHMEAQYCLDSSVGAQTVLRCTHAINALNKIRSGDPSLVAPSSELFRLTLEAHSARAVLENNTQTADSILEFTSAIPSERTAGPSGGSLRSLHAAAYDRAAAEYVPGVGARVLIHGLTSEAGSAMNGTEGTVDGPLRSNNRLPVLIDPWPSQLNEERKIVALKPANIQLQ